MQLPLTKIERDWINALGTAFSPEGQHSGGDRLVPRPGEVDYATTFAHINGPAGLKVRVGVRLAAALLATAPIWNERTLKTVSQLGPSEREALAHTLATHPLRLVRELTLLMKVQVSMAKLGTQSVRARSNYDRGRAEGMPVQIRRKEQTKEVA